MCNMTKQFVDVHWLVPNKSRAPHFDFSTKLQKPNTNYDKHERMKSWVHDHNHDNTDRNHPQQVEEQIQVGLKHDDQTCVPDGLGGKSKSTNVKHYTTPTNNKQHRGKIPIREPRFKNICKLSVSVAVRSCLCDSLAQATPRQ